MGKEGKPVFPRRMFTKNDEPYPRKSIGYFSGWRDILNLLKEKLVDDEWEELKNLHLGLFIHFHELEFSWAYRVVHYMLDSQLVCKKRHEIWTLIGVEPMRFSLHEFEHLTGLNCDYIEKLGKPDVETSSVVIAFWDLLGVCIETDPSFFDLLAACGRCCEWSREDRIRLGYLAIYVNFIEAPYFTNPTDAAMARLVIDPYASVNYPWGRLTFKILIDSVKAANVTKAYSIQGFIQVLHVWVLYSLPFFGRKYGSPLPNAPLPPLLAYKGSRGQKYLKTAM